MEKTKADLLKYIDDKIEISNSNIKEFQNNYINYLKLNLPNRIYRFLGYHEGKEYFESSIQRETAKYNQLSAMKEWMEII